MSLPEDPAGRNWPGAVLEVVYALPGVQRVVELQFAEGMTAIQAIEAAGLLQEFPELASRTLTLGIFGRVVPSTQLLRPGDRVEIYRPLRADPREARRRLAAAGRTMGRAASGSSDE
jgi:hypothetical protein